MASKLLFLEYIKYFDNKKYTWERGFCDVIVEMNSRVAYELLSGACPRIGFNGNMLDACKELLT